MNPHSMLGQAPGQASQGHDGAVPLQSLPALRASLAWMPLLSIHETSVGRSGASALYAVNLPSSRWCSCDCTNLLNVSRLQGWSIEGIYFFSGFAAT